MICTLISVKRGTRIHNKIHHATMSLISFFILSLGICTADELNTLNQIGSAVNGMGDTQCAQQVSKVSNFLGFQQNSGALLMTPKKERANERLIPVVIEQPISKNDTALVSATFSPYGKADCMATYDAYVVWSDFCQSVASKHYGNLKISGKLKQNITVLDGGPNVRIFLIPVGNMCISVKKEIFYESKTK